MRRGLLHAVVAFVLVVSVSVLSSQVASGAATPTSAECVALGLKPIDLSLNVFDAGFAGLNIPSLAVKWSAEPLPRICGARTIVAARARVWFAKLSGPIELGISEEGRWRYFWSGRTHVHDGKDRLTGPSLTFSTGCVVKAKAWVRYEVLGPKGVPLAHLTRRAPVSTSICRRRLATRSIRPLPR
jgi:hypothetical protein